MSVIRQECPPLIAESIGKLDNFGHAIDLERVASHVINSEWHYSWHWDRDKTKCWSPMTSKGWRQAMQDGCRLLAALESHAKEIRDILPLIQAEIDRMERLEAEDDE